MSVRIWLSFYYRTCVLMRKGEGIWPLFTFIYLILILDFVLVRQNISCIRTIHFHMWSFKHSLIYLFFYLSRSTWYLLSTSCAFSSPNSDRYRKLRKLGVWLYFCPFSWNQYFLSSCFGIFLLLGFQLSKMKLYLSRIQCYYFIWVLVSSSCKNQTELWSRFRINHFNR